MKEIHINNDRRPRCPRCNNSFDAEENEDKVGLTCPYCGHGGRDGEFGLEDRWRDK